MAQEGRRELRVEHRGDGAAERVVDDLEVLPAGVEDLRDRVVAHEGRDAREVIEQDGVDRDALPRGQADLQQAQTRVEGLLAKELGVDRDDALGLCALEKGCKLVGFGDVHKTPLVVRA